MCSSKVLLKDMSLSFTLYRFCLNKVCEYRLARSVWTLACNTDVNLSNIVVQISLFYELVHRFASRSTTGSMVMWLSSSCSADCQGLTSTHLTSISLLPSPCLDSKRSTASRKSERLLTRFSTLHCFKGHCMRERCSSVRRFTSTYSPKV